MICKLKSYTSGHQQNKAFIYVKKKIQRLCQPTFLTSTVPYLNLNKMNIRPLNISPDGERRAKPKTHHVCALVQNTIEFGLSLSSSICKTLLGYLYCDATLHLGVFSATLCNFPLDSLFPISTCIFGARMVNSSTKCRLNVMDSFMVWAVTG